MKPCVYSFIQVCVKFEDGTWLKTQDWAYDC